MGGSRLGLIAALAVTVFSVAAFPRLPETLPVLAAVGANTGDEVAATETGSTHPGEAAAAAEDHGPPRNDGAVDVDGLMEDDGPLGGGVPPDEADAAILDALVALETGSARGIPRWPGAFVGAGLALGIWLALALLARFDPGRGETDDLWANVWRIGNLLVLLTALVHAFTLAAALGLPADVGRLLPAAVGVVLLALADYLPRARPRALVAIRTPWTLAHEQVWIETHRLAGRTFLFGALVTFCAVVAPESARPALALAGAGIGGFVPVVHSFLAARRATANAGR